MLVVTFSGAVVAECDVLTPCVRICEQDTAYIPWIAFWCFVFGGFNTTDRRSKSMHGLKWDGRVVVVGENGSHFHKPLV